MRVAFCGYTIHIATSHLVFLPVNLLHLKKSTQCPGRIIQCPGVITKCSEIMIMCPETAPLRSLVMRACARPLKSYPVLCGIIQTLSSRSNNCPPVPRNNVTDRQGRPTENSVSPSQEKEESFLQKRKKSERVC